AADRARLRGARRRGRIHRRHRGSAPGASALLPADGDRAAEHRPGGGAQRRGVDLVLGHVPLHPDSPPNLLSWGTGLWAEMRRERLAAPGAEVRADDLLTGQCSIARALFEELGGFDTSFTRDGLFGGEDIDFGYRLLQAGRRVAFNSAAISHQLYDVDPRDYLRRAYEAGRSEQEL